MRMDDPRVPIQTEHVKMALAEAGYAHVRVENIEGRDGEATLRIWDTPPAIAWQATMLSRKPMDAKGPCWTCTNAGQGGNEHLWVECQEGRCPETGPKTPPREKLRKPGFEPLVLEPL